MFKRILVTVFGQVQGVFFRANVLKKASQLGLVGWVANEGDGTVKILAEGEEEKLNKLIEYCQSGPTFAKVHKVEVKWDRATGEFKEFMIR